MRRVGLPGARATRFGSERMSAGVTRTHCSAQTPTVFREACRRGKSRAELPARGWQERILDLRRCYASRVLSLGENLPMIGKLVGHRKVQTTARYAHLARDSVKAAAETVSDSLAADLDTPPNAPAVT